MSGPFKNWSRQEMNAAESVRTQNARERFQQNSAYQELQTGPVSAKYAAKVKKKMEKVYSKLPDLSMRRVEPAENEQ